MPFNSISEGSKCVSMGWLRSIYQARPLEARLERHRRERKGQHALPGQQGCLQPAGDVPRVLGPGRFCSPRHRKSLTSMTGGK